MGAVRDYLAHYFETYSTMYILTISGPTITYGPFMGTLGCVLDATDSRQGHILVIGKLIMNGLPPRTTLGERSEVAQEVLATRR